MAAKNDITGDSIQTRTKGKTYDSNFDKIDKTIRLVEEESKETDLDEMKARFLEHWGYEGEKGEKEWEAKLAFMQRQGSISVPYVRDDVKPYQSMIDGRMIEGKKAHREHLKRNNCIEAADMPLKNPERPKDNSLKERLIYEVMERHRGQWR
jgi:hypothetical protein